MTLIIQKPTGAKLNLAKTFVVQDYMWLFPTQYGLWSPANITTALWLDAADASTITLASSAVSEWRDKSGNARHASQATSARRPTVDSALLNGKDVVAFANTNSQWMQLASYKPFASNAANGSFMAVQRQTSGINGVVASTRNSAGGWSLRNNSTTQIIQFFTNASPNLTATQEERPQISGFTTQSLARILYVEGTNAASGAASTYNSDDRSLQIGAEANGGSSFLNGYIGEIIISDFVWSTDTRQRIEGYLAHKWGLTANLPSDHPYKTVGPTP
jgi:hypothetical protein